MRVRLVFDGLSTDELKDVLAKDVFRPAIVGNDGPYKFNADTESVTIDGETLITLLTLLQRDGKPNVNSLRRSPVRH